VLPAGSTRHVALPANAYRAVADDCSRQRFAQTISPFKNRSLLQMQMPDTKETGTTGNFLLPLVAVDQATAMPSQNAKDVLASAIIPDTAVPVGDSRLTGECNGPLLLLTADLMLSIFIE
jgi:hypothetical protein